MAKGKIAFIGDIDTVLGFKALGVEVIVPKDDADAREQFKRLAKEETSVIMVTEDIADPIKEEIEDTMHRAIPTVVVLPGIQGSSRRGEETIRELIIKAVGVDLMAEKKNKG